MDEIVDQYPIDYDLIRSETKFVLKSTIDANQDKTVSDEKDIVDSTKVDEKTEEVETKEDNPEQV